MKIQKEFAPMTIRIETQADLSDLRSMLYVALRGEQKCSVFRGTTDLGEKIKVFLRDLGENVL